MQLPRRFLSRLLLCEPLVALAFPSLVMTGGNFGLLLFKFRPTLFLRFLLFLFSVSLLSQEGFF